MNYFIQHWRGGLSLNQSFWVNFVIPIALFLALGSLFSEFLLIQNPGIATFLTLVFIALFLLIYIWQVVGVLRASDRFAIEQGDRAWSTAAQVGVVFSIVIAVVIIFGAYQNLLAFNQSLQKTQSSAIEKQYLLELDASGTHVYLSGPLQTGITRALKELIVRHRSIETIVLRSDGGRIYEGRGLSMTIRDAGLNTHVDGACMSACTTVFIGGAKRTLSAKGKLGFHQYKTFSVQQNIDVDDEQRRDIALFLHQGVSEAFLDKAFSTPFEEMWFPSTDELVEAGVLNSAKL